MMNGGFVMAASPESLVTAAISANAVQSAPVGLALTVSTAAIFAETTITTATIATATKAVSMTTLQKTLITATIAVLAGAGIYEARQITQLREQNQTLQQQQAPLADQIEQLQHERDEATNRMAKMLAENSRLKSNPNQMELLKLRGKVGQMRSLQNNVAALQKLANQSVSGWANGKVIWQRMSAGQAPQTRCKPIFGQRIRLT